MKRIIKTFECLECNRIVKNRIYHLSVEHFEIYDKWRNRIDGTEDEDFLVNFFKETDKEVTKINYNPSIKR